eukprot:251176-Rhodomonas_salina.2
MEKEGGAARRKAGASVTRKRKSVSAHSRGSRAVLPVRTGTPARDSNLNDSSLPSALPETSYRDWASVT